MHLKRILQRLVLLKVFKEFKDLVRHKVMFQHLAIHKQVPPHLVRHSQMCLHSVHNSQMSLLSLRHNQMHLRSDHYRLTLKHSVRHHKLKQVLQRSDSERQRQHNRLDSAHHRSELQQPQQQPRHHHSASVKQYQQLNHLLSVALVCLLNLHFQHSGLQRQQQRQRHPQHWVSRHYRNQLRMSHLE